MSKIKVHILEFLECSNTHVEIVLEERTTSGKRYYRLNQWNHPKDAPAIDDQASLQRLELAFKDVSYEIDGDLDQIVQAWKNKHNTEETSFCFNNCADATAWFLATFGQIENPGSCAQPITCNYLFCGLFAPSFLQYCTVPGRVVDYAEHQIRHRETHGEEQLLLANAPKPLVMS